MPLDKYLTDCYQINVNVNSDGVLSSASSQVRGRGVHWGIEYLFVGWTHGVGRPF